MSFYVDIVTEDSFYENLTLGVVKILENLPYIKNVRIDRRNGCESTTITNWEQRHCCVLPEDVKNFYVSIDGFLLQWNLEIAGNPFGELSTHFQHTLCQLSSTNPVLLMLLRISIFSLPIALHLFIENNKKIFYSRSKNV